MHHKLSPEGKLNISKPYYNLVQTTHSIQFIQYQRLEKANLGQQVATAAAVAPPAVAHIFLPSEAKTLKN